MAAYKALLIALCGSVMVMALASQPEGCEADTSSGIGRVLLQTRNDKHAHEQEEMLNMSDVGGKEEMEDEQTRPINYIGPIRADWCKDNRDIGVICSGSQTDCVDKGKQWCNARPECKGFMWHPSWSRRGSMKMCTSTQMSPFRDWYAWMKTTATTTTTPFLVTSWSHSWDFRGGSGSIVKDEESNLMARVKNPKWTSQGLYFNGKDTTVTLDPWPLGGDISFEVYLAFDKSTTWRASQMVFEFTRPGAFHLRRNPQGALGIFQNRQDGVHGYKQIGRNFWQLGKWTHVVCTFNAREMNLFVDGRFLGKVRTGYQASIAKRQFNTIGSTQGRWWLFHGTFAYLRIWQSKVLDAAAVQALYKLTKTTTTTTMQVVAGNETFFDRLDQNDDGQLDKNEFDVFWPPGGQ